MREKMIEEFLRDGVRRLGGVAFKFVSPGNVGVPDRLILFPGGRMVFVEVKAKGGRLSVMQERQRKRIRALGFQVAVVEGIDQARMFLDMWGDQLGGQ